MKITADQIFKHAGVVRVQNVECDLEKSNIQEFDENASKQEVIIFHPRSKPDEWYCPANQIIELNDQGKGVIKLWLDMYEELSEAQRTVDYPILVQCLIPMTEEVLTRKLLTGK